MGIDKYKRIFHLMDLRNGKRNVYRVWSILQTYTLHGFVITNQGKIFTQIQVSLSEILLAWMCFHPADIYIDHFRVFVRPVLLGFPIRIYSTFRYGLASNRAARDFASGISPRSAIIKASLSGIFSTERNSSSSASRGLCFKSVARNTAMNSVE